MPRNSRIAKPLAGLLLVALLLTALGASQRVNGARLADYQDPTLPVEQRVSDLLSRMTLDEKIGQMTQAERSVITNVNDLATYSIGSILSGGGSAPSPNTPTGWADMVDQFQTAALRSRLRIPMLYGVDAVHGHNNMVGAVIFPHNIGLGATRNPALAQQIGDITAREVYATGIRWTFSPCLCVARDERWGRTYESFSEEPELATALSTIIDGYQGSQLNERGSVLATAKHYLADGGTVWGSSSSGLNEGNAPISEAELRRIHLPPYIEAVRRNVGSIMPSYSSWNGTKMHASRYLLTDVLKGELGFSGFVISDWAAIDQIPGDYASDVRTSINAGVDMVMVPYNYLTFINTLKAEVQAGRVTTTRIDDAVRRILTKKFELGLFEQPFADRSEMSLIGSQAHRDVARQAVRESLVLLKNNNNLLPLAPSGRILVAGGSADNIGLQSGGWTISWQGESGNITPGTTILQGIRNVAPSSQVTYIRNPTSSQATGYDVGIVVVGEQPYAESRGDDSDLSLSAEDASAVQQVCGTIRCVVVLVSGRPMIINTQLTQAQAFVAAWLPGTEGAGVAEVLFGRYNFVGKLPMSWPRSMSQIPINVGDATYDPLFPFGFGLSYGTTPTATPTTQPTSTPTARPTNTPTTQPTNTPTARPTNTPTPTASCNAITVFGRITDAGTGQGIAGATVWANTSISQMFSATSASDGTYTLAVPSSHACQVIGLQVVASGYQSVVLPVTPAELAAQPQRNFALSRTTVTATPVTPTSTPTRTPVIPTATPTRTPIIPTATSTSTPATPTTTVYPTICQVTYRVVSQWGNGFTADVTIKNLGGSVSSWALAWTFSGDQRISNAWNAAVTQSGASVTARNMPYNGTLTSGASTTFGFQASYSGTNNTPPFFTFNGGPCAVMP